MKFKALHKKAKEVACRYHRAEAEMIDVLIELERTRAYEELHHPRLFYYAVKELKLTESVANYFITVARKAAAVPELREAFHEQQLSVASVAKYVSKITKENVLEVIEYGSKHSAAKTQKWLFKDDEAKQNLKLALRIVEKLKTSRSLIKKNVDLEETIEILADEFIKRRDPVAKAERALERKKKLDGKLLETSRVAEQPPESLETSRVAEQSTESLKTSRADNELETSRAEAPRAPRKRKKIAAVHHEVHNRDRRQCQFQIGGEEKCGLDKYIHLHHIIPVAMGGPDTVENLITLCSFHHELVHQLEFPFEDQKKWQERLPEMIT